MLIYNQKEKTGVFQKIPGSGPQPGKEHTMSKYYTQMTISGLRDKLDELEEKLFDIESEYPDDYDQRKSLENLINNICELICEREGAVA